MAYTNLNDNKTHGIFESSRITATDIGRIYDLLMVDDMTAKTPIDIDNGVAVAVQDYTKNGLQERYGTVAEVTDKIAVVGAPALVKSAATKGNGDATNFYIPAGTVAKAYMLSAETEDIFAVASYQFADESTITDNAYVVVSGDGLWEASATKPTGHGFVGQVHSVSQGLFYKIVRIRTIQNEAVTE